MTARLRTTRIRSAFRACAAFLACAAFTASAHAAPLIASEVLQQFNLVVFGDAKSSSHVDGRTYIGGNVTGGDYVLHANDMPASEYAGLVVGGNASNLNVNGGGISVGGNLSNANINKGSAYVAGNASSVNFNGGTAYVGGTTSGSNFNGGRSYTAATQQSTATIESTMRDLALQLAGLSSTGSTVSINGNKATFNAVADANGLAVFDLTSIDTALFKLGEFEFNLGGADTVIFNVDDLVISIFANFLGGSAQAIGANVIWNFYNATDITLYSQFGGSVLAPNAALTNYNNIEGSVVVSSIDQRGEIHLQPFSGTLPTTTTDEPPTTTPPTTTPPTTIPPTTSLPPENHVPEPGSLALMLAALLAMAPLSRQRKAAAARKR